LNGFVLKADPRREETFSNEVRREYDQMSIVGKAFEPHDVKVEEKDDFVRIGRRFHAGPETFVEEYSRRGEKSYSSTILGLGRVIAIGEEKYFISKISNAFRTVTAATKDEMLDFIESQAYRFSAVFMPIDYYTEFHSFPPQRGSIWYGQSERLLMTNKYGIRPFFSSKYVEFDKFFFITPESVEWLVKPDPRTGHRVRVSVVPNDEVRKFDVTCETVASLKIRDREAGVAFKLKEPPTPSS